jgi:hypothetical protein
MNFAWRIASRALIAQQPRAALFAQTPGTALIAQQPRAALFAQTPGATLGDGTGGL